MGSIRIELGVMGEISCIPQTPARWMQAVTKPGTVIKLRTHQQEEGVLGENPCVAFCILLGQPLSPECPFLL